VLIDKGAATASIVYEMIHRQVEELFFATLVMNDGVFTFTSEIDLSELPAYISLDTNNLLLEGVRRLDELEYFHKLIPGPNIVLQRKSRSFPPRLQEEVEDVFLGHCDGRRTLGELAETTGLGEYEATRLAYQLLQEGALEVIPTESTRDDSLQFIVGRFNDMIDRVVETVDAAGFGQPFLLEMRAFPLSGGEFQDCTERLDLDEEGHLDYDNVVEILADTDVEDRMSYIVQVLTQYVFYCLFLSDRYLTRDTHRKLGIEVHTMLQKIGA